MDKMTKIAIHQPMYLPYPGVFNKMKNVDAFVFLDDAKYSDGYYYNRNRIKTPRGALMLTVPIKKSSGEKLNEIKIENNIFWQKKHMKSLVVYYEKSDHFKDYRDFFEKVYNINTKWKKLHDLNMRTMQYLMEQLDIDTPFYFSSELLKNRPFMKGTQRLVELCKELDAEIYLSGISGRNYLDKRLFEENNIKLDFQNYVPKEYKQLYGDFISNLSIVDLLFNLEKKARDFI
jgi:hypothetical protein